MTDGGQTIPYIASLRAWERLGFANRHALRGAIRRGDLRAIRTGKRTIRITYPDLIRWMDLHVVRPDDVSGDW